MKLLKQQWKYLLIASFAIAWIVLFSKWSNWITEDPLNAPMSLNPAGKVEHTIDIRIPAKYELSFIFERAGQPFEKLRTLIGAMGACKINEPCSKGIPVPIKWSLSEIKSGDNVTSGASNSEDSHGWSASEVDRRIAFIKVKPGYYVFKAEVMQSVPELESLKPRIAIKLSRSSETWHIGLAWWGAIVTYIIIWPIMICSIIVIIQRILWPNKANQPTHKADS